MASYIEQVAKTVWHSMNDQEVMQLHAAFEQAAANMFSTDEQLEWEVLDGLWKHVFEDVVARTIKIYEATKEASQENAAFHEQEKSLYGEDTPVTLYEEEGQ